MKKLTIVIGFITAILAVILAVTPLSNLAIAPLFIAIISGVIIFLISKRDKTKPKAIQYILLLSFIALSITLYKVIFTTSEIGDIEILEQRDDENLEDSKEILEDIEIDENF